jgi:DNA-binding helix-hairpin-helix protein with protein kinase domain
VIAVVDDQRRPVRLGSELARGGEGAVYEVLSDTSLVAKIYLKPVNETKLQKLSVMARSATPDILKFAAWPKSLLHSSNKTVGFLMPRAPASSRAIHELYTPKTRLREYPGANWQSLVNVAANVCRSFAVIHERGHIVGDINHGNILVAPNAIAAFIDCDSFQVQSNGQVYPCEVGVSTYTPPELQGKSFDKVIRTRNHDSFGLGVLLFHLLFMGRHPFAGRYSGSGYMPIERAIAEYRFAFGRLAAQMSMSPPPSSLLLTQVSPKLAGAFEQAFSPDAVRCNSRPSALEWVSILEEFQRELTRCKSNQAHIYFSQLTACPWCGIEAKGVIFFIDFRADVTGTNIEVIWRTLTSLAPIGDLPGLPPIQNLGISASQEARTIGRTRKLRVGIGVLVIIASVCLLFAANANGLVTLLVMGGAIAFAYQFPQRVFRKRRTYAKVVNESQRNFDELHKRYSSECSQHAFNAKMKELETLRAEHSQLPLIRQKNIQELEKNKYQVQLFDYLDRINLADARISSIGPGRKAILASYGIDSAADVSYATVTKVPGIGPKYASNLLAWRQLMESKFRFDPSKSVPAAEIEKINREFRSRRSNIEGALSRGANDATALHGRILALRRAYHDQLLASSALLAQARANYAAS